MEDHRHRWWQRAIVYEIYPRSFLDSDGDGVGDLEGVRRALPYLEWLGVDALWIAPFYPSPMKDFGYDVSDYCGVDARFGDMAGFERLLAEAHARGLRVVIDLVPNHSSDQHRWFREAAASRASSRRDWYLWADAADDGGPPNNWLSEFGGSAWQWHEQSRQYYYHAFDASQPDFNWRNREVHEAFFEVMRFWLAKGVDGFRVDVMWHLLKDERLRDNPPNPDYDPRRDPPYRALVPVYSANLPEVHDVVAELRRVLDEFEDRVLIGEVYLPIGELVKYYGLERSEAHLPFNFQLVKNPWDGAHLRLVIDEYLASIPGGHWPNWVLGNHDQARVASRVGQAQARVAAVLLLTLRGTPTMYYGDEIGMPNVPVPPEQARDPRELGCPGRGHGRDPYRAPMPWNGSAHAGFSSSEPWLPLWERWPQSNVAAQREDPRSLLTLYRELIGLRRREPALAIGEQRSLPAQPPLLAYLRFTATRAFAVVLNLGARPQRFDLAHRWGAGAIAISTHPERSSEAVDGVLTLEADEAVVVALNGPARAAAPGD